MFANGTCYYKRPELYTFSVSDVVQLVNGMFSLIALMIIHLATHVGIGSKKSVRFVEGPKGRGYNNAAVVVECKFFVAVFI